MLGVRSQAAAQRREAILAAALRCFLDKGFTATTIDDIRRQSGASTGSIYHQFETKEQIAEALYRDGLNRYRAGFLEAIASAADARARIDAVVRYHFRWIAENADLARFLILHWETRARRELNLEGEERRSSFYHQVAEWLQHEAARGALAPLPRSIAIAALLGPLHHFSQRWLSGETTLPLDEATRLLSTIVWRSLTMREEE